MNDKHRGPIKNAPLAYVLAVIQIQSIPKYHAFMPDVQDSLRDYLPNYNPVKKKSNEIEISSTGEVTNTESEMIHYYFTDVESQYGVMVRDDRILLHALNYVGFEEFRSRFEDLVNMIKDVLRIKYYKGAGIRYIDQISEVGELSIEDIIKSDFLPRPFGKHCLPGTSQGHIEFYNQTTYGHLFLRSTMAREHPPVPKNLMDSYSVLAGDKSQMVKGALILDTDHVFGKADRLREFDVGEMFDELDAMHDVCKDVFYEIVDVPKLEGA